MTTFTVIALVPGWAGLMGGNLNSVYAQYEDGEFVGLRIDFR